VDGPAKSPWDGKWAQSKIWDVKTTGFSTGDSDFAGPSTGFSHDFHCPKSRQASHESTGGIQCRVCSDFLGAVAGMVFWGTGFVGQIGGLTTQQKWEFRRKSDKKLTDVDKIELKVSATQLTKNDLASTGS
jgi:hypothetical protein